MEYYNKWDLYDDISLDYIYIHDINQNPSLDHYLVDLSQVIKILCTNDMDIDNIENVRTINRKAFIPLFDFILQTVRNGNEGKHLFKVRNYFL